MSHGFLGKWLPPCLFELSETELQSKKIGFSQITIASSNRTKSKTVLFGKLHQRTNLEKPVHKQSYPPMKNHSCTLLSIIVRQKNPAFILLHLWYSQKGLIIQPSSTARSHTDEVSYVRTMEPATFESSEEEAFPGFLKYKQM